MKYVVTPLVVATILLGAGAAGAGEATTAPPGDEMSVTTAPGTPADVRPRIAERRVPVGAVAEGPVPQPEAVAEQIAEELDSSWLGPGNRRAITVRDALTGESLADRNATRLGTPASTTKLLSAAAITTALDGGTTFTTRVVAGEEPGQVVIVAGGDMLLANGRGDPEAVAGHAGIADLAEQTAAALAARHGDQPAATAGPADEAAATTGATGADGATGPVPLEGPVQVALDLSHVPGPHALPTWTDLWVDEGYAGRIVQLGRSVDRALPFNPSPREPEQQVARVFREALTTALDDHGLDLEVAGAGDDGAEAPEVAVPEDTVELAAVESAALRDVLALALATSDNAMVEQLARQAAAAEGLEPDLDTVTTWIEDTMVEDYGLDMTGAQVADASGLSDGTLLQVATVADVLVAGSDGSHPQLQEVLAAGGLPIAGYTGTLSSRFHLPVHEPAVGAARAKTGTLPGVTSLAGTVVSADGRLLVYAITADAIEDGGATLEARSVVDEIVAELARCGC